VNINISENLDAIEADKLVVTKSGSLLCKRVIHIKSRSFPDHWKDGIRRCLEKVEELGFSSVSFPALGTGMLVFTM